MGRSLLLLLLHLRAFRFSQSSHQAEISNPSGPNYSRCSTTRLFSPLRRPRLSTPSVDSMPKNDGWKTASGQRKRSLPMVMTCPSGNSNDFALGSGGERVTTFGQDFHQVISKITTSQIQ